MPRRRDIRCAGTCGQLIWRGRGTLPEGEGTCRACRAERRVGLSRPPKVQLCTHCGGAFARATAGQSACSHACDIASRTLRPWACPGCGDVVLSFTGTKLCPPCKAARTQAHNRVKNAKRRGAAVSGPMLTMPQMGLREGWRCHLCLRRVDPALKNPHPMAATFDHLIPVAEDGTDAPENLRLAHRTCNTRRGTKGTVQLLLVG